MWDQGTKLARALLDGAQAGVGAVTGAGRAIPVPVYLIHRSADANDYDVRCDFTELFDAVRRSMLSTPRLEVWSGRGDFDRRHFARRLREAFIAQVEAEKETRRRAEDDAAAEADGGWYGGLTLSALLGVLMAANPLTNLLLLGVAAEAGVKGATRAAAGLKDQVLSLLPGPDRSAGPTPAELAARKAEIDAVLAQIEVKLHGDLFAHAHRFGNGVTTAEGLDLDAWPLPEPVRQRINTPAHPPFAALLSGG